METNRLSMKLKYNFFSQTTIQLLLMNGVKKEAVYSLPGFSFNKKDPLESFITIEFIEHLVILYKNHMNTSHCGLEIFKSLDFRNADFFGPYAFSCATLGEAVQKIYEVQSQINPLLTYEMLPPEKPSYFVYNLDKMWEAKYPESAHEIIEFIIASGLASSRLVTKQNIQPLKLHLKYGEPEDNSVYKEIFNCPVFFGMEANVIYYPSTVLDYKIPTYNPTLLSILQEFAQKTIRENELKQDIISKVKTEIIKAGSNSIPKEEDIANNLNMGKRTLQKRLHEKNISFLKILDDIQKELAFAYLSSDTISNKEISWMLGYNDISNFYRAFKRWTGTTPNEYRLANG